MTRNGAMSGSENAEIRTADGRARLPAAVQLLPTFDTRRLQEELATVTRYKWERQRTSTKEGIGAPTQLDWRVLPLRSIGGDGDRTDPGGPGPVGFASTPHLRTLPYLADILGRIPAPLNAARLMALGPRTACRPHRDSKYALSHGMVRLHLPIVTDPGAVLVLDDVTYRWKPGELWAGEFSRPHHVANGGDESRVHLVVDALMTRGLAALYPPRWLDELHDGRVLFNRPAQPLAEQGWFSERTIRIPAAFTDFAAAEPSDGPPAVVARLDIVGGSGGAAQLTTNDGNYALVHVGEHEFRFTGWSEQRTLQLTPRDVVLRARRGASVTERRLPTAFQLGDGHAAQ